MGPLLREKRFDRSVTSVHVHLKARLQPEVKIVKTSLLLNLQFSDQFKELREAARLAREKSQERFELANPALSIAAPEVHTCSK